MNGELSKSAWRVVWSWTALMLVISIPASIIATDAILTIFAGGMGAAGLAAAVAVPLVLGGPATFVMAIKHQQLKQANRQLHVLASTDELTAILNRRAFTSLVASYLGGGAPMQEAPEGAFLVIDADDFKRINDRHGHQWGDEALQRIAASIKASVRDGDLVGRIGGEEFGVLLIDADLTTAGSVAERIRRAVDALVFEPDGAKHQLSVSVGGATFGGSVPFSTLYRAADQRLYEAKQSGRNCVSLVAMLDDDPARAA